MDSKNEFHQRVEIVEYNENWPIRFKEEARQIHKAMKLLHALYQIHHVGGTSIPGMASKPIIDILVTVEQERIDKASFILDMLCGYYYFGECGRPGRIFMSKGSSAQNAFYLHLTTKDNKVAVDQLAFHDILMNHPALAAEYVRVKKAAAAEYPRDRGNYQNAKRPFIESVLYTETGGENL